MCQSLLNIFNSDDADVGLCGVGSLRGVRQVIDSMVWLSIQRNCLEDELVVSCGHEMLAMNPVISFRTQLSIVLSS